VIKLLINGVPSEIIILYLLKEICNKIKSEDVKSQLIKWASFYDTRAQNGSKTLFHIEALIARFMLIIAQNNTNNKF